MSESLVNQTTIKTLAARMRGVRPKNPTEIALKGLMAGVLFSLQKAIELNFSDARMKQSVAAESLEIDKTLEAIEHVRMPVAPWLAGFYVVSAIMRLDTFYQRMNAYKAVTRKLANKVSQINKRIKHWPEGGLSTGWNVSLSEIVSEAEGVCDLLVQELSEG